MPDETVYNPAQALYDFVVECKNHKGSPTLEQYISQKFGSKSRPGAMSHFDRIVRLPDKAVTATQAALGESAAVKFCAWHTAASQFFGNMSLVGSIDAFRGHIDATDLVRLELCAETLNRFGRSPAVEELVRKIRSFRDEVDKMSLDDQLQQLMVESLDEIERALQGFVWAWSDSGARSSPPRWK